MVEKETFAIHFALQRLDHYLHNNQSVMRTDHTPLKYLLQSPVQNKKIQLQALSMSGYNYTIEYIAGTTNKCADLLSRHTDNVKKTSDDQNCEDVEDQTVLDVSDKLYEINVLDSTQFEPKSLQAVICQMVSHLKSVIFRTLCMLSIAIVVILLLSLQ